MNTKPDGIFLSNGPGDPYATGENVIETLKKLIKIEIPIFGICLGHQILSLALNAKTKKMFQGHRGSNHPVKNLTRDFVEITSQNHGFEVDRNTFSDDIIETHVSLFDGTNEGLKHKHYLFLVFNIILKRLLGHMIAIIYSQIFINSLKNMPKKNLI